MLTKIIKGDHSLIYLLAFFIGQCAFILKLVSVTKIINELPIQSYPTLMLIQGIVFFVVLNVLKSFSGKSNHFFYIITTVLSFFTILFTFQKSYLSHIGIQDNFYISCIIFMLSSILIVALDISFKSISSNRISLLKDPHSLGIILLLHEFGTIFSAILTNITINISPIMLAIPFFASLILFIYLSIGLNINTKKITKHEENISLIKQLPFLSYLIPLIMIIFTLKQMQGYAVLQGIIELKRNYDISLVSLFSYISIFQTLIILLILGKSIFKKNPSTRWSKGFNKYLTVQSVSMILIAIVSSPFALVLTGSLRKVIQRGYFNHSYSLLIASIPTKYHFSVRGFIEKYCQLASFSILAILSYLHINNIIPSQLMWMIVALIALVGLKLRQYLLKDLNKFHLKNLLNFKKSNNEDIPDLVNSSYALANKQASENSLSLLMIITQGPPILLEKALIFALGEMNPQKSHKVLRRMFLKKTREDVQLSILNTLLKYDSEENILFYQEILNTFIITDTNTDIMKISIFRALIEHRATMVNDFIKINMAKDLPENHLINYINITGELYRIHSSLYDRELLMPYTLSEFSSEVRVAAFISLYRNKPVDDLITNYIKELYTNINIENNSLLFCRITSQVQHLDFLEKVSQIFSKNEKPTPSELISMLRSKTDDSSSIFIEHVLKLEGKEKNRLLSLFAHIKDDSIRFNVYSELTKYHIGSLQHFIEDLQATGKEFDKDINMICIEANRLGVLLISDKILDIDY